MCKLMKYSSVPQGDEDCSREHVGDVSSGETGVPLLNKTHITPIAGVPASHLLTDDDIEAALLKPAKPHGCCIPFDALSGSWYAGSGGSRSTSSFWLKFVILVSVTLQNTGYCLLRRYSRGQLKETYSSSTALLVMELVKLALSARMLLVSSEPSDVPSGASWSKYMHLLRHSAKMAVPAVIYLIMNVLSFFALARVDASTFAIVAQLKVLTTALCSVGVLGRSLQCRKWRALITLTLGVILISEETRPKSASAGLAASAPLVEWMLGMAAVFVEVLLSGFACIYFEKVLKSADETYSVWDRNFQLAFWSICIYLPMALFDNPTDPFAGWSWTATACSALGAAGGVLVALSIKHTDSVMKTIATTGSIVLTTSLNAAFLDGPLNTAIIIGALVVVVSVFNYSDNGEN
mmetsp:Transcript_5566/g.12146  ORF Transcript_5566/g.12146 Transcript_5566/m.12146 type:complete len:407 (+) Transcript_5566:164-1384(+)